MRDGEFISVDENNTNVLSFLRKTSDGKAALVALNFTPSPQTVSFDFTPHGVQGKHAKTVLASFPTHESADIGRLVLSAYGAYIAKIEP